MNPKETNEYNKVHHWLIKYAKKEHFREFDPQFIEKTTNKHTCCNIYKFACKYKPNKIIHRNYTTITTMIIEYHPVKETCRRID